MAHNRPSTRPAPLPRLPNKEKRLPGGLRLLPPVEAGIRAIARRENWSRSRVIAWLVHDWFRLNPETGEPMRHKLSRSPRALSNGLGGIDLSPRGRTSARV